jgi:cytidine deaminase
MVLAGGRQIVAVAIAGAGGGLVTPCGGCRQKLREFGGGDLIIHICDEHGSLRRSFSLQELLPYSFGPENLVS